MNNIVSIPSDLCTGCGVCAAVCPNNCIDLLWDADGYYKAKLLPSAVCVNCGKCLSACYVNLQSSQLPQSPSRILIGSNRDTRIRYSSSSGGLGNALAKAALDLGYLVIGAEWDIQAHTVQARHVCVDKETDLPKLRGSKYVPSNTKEAFREIKNNPGKKFIVFGTPCQIASLRMQYGKSDRLLLVDFRCGGPNSQLMLSKHVLYLNKINSSGLRSINMRDKSKGTFAFGLRADYNDNSLYCKSKLHDDFLFNQTYFGIRSKACANCQVLKNKSFADIRIEDAWHELPLMHRNDFHDGLTKISLYSDAGASLFTHAEEQISYFALPSEALEETFQPAKYDPFFFHLLRDDTLSLAEVNNRYLKTMPLTKRTRIKLESLILYSYPLQKISYTIVRAIRNILRRRIKRQ